MTARELAERLGADEMQAGWYTGIPCPVHGDEAYPLRFRSEPDGAIRFECGAGCRAPLIGQALGLPADAFVGTNGQRPTPTPPDNTTSATSTSTPGDAEAAFQDALLDELQAFAFIDELRTRRLPMEQRHARYYSRWVTLVALVPSEATRDSLINSGRDVFGYRNQSMRDDVNRLRAASAAAGEPARTAAQQEADALERAAKLDELRAQAAPILVHDDDPLQRIEQELRAIGWGGDVRPLLVVYLAATSRVLPLRKGQMPTHTQLNGVAGAGKSYALNLVLSLLPNSAFVKYDAGSKMILVHDHKEDPRYFQHRVLIYSEADSLPGAVVSMGTLKTVLHRHCSEPCSLKVIVPTPWW